MPYSTNGKNAMLDALAGVAVFASLHTGDPGDNGANEVSGGDPAYIRKAITWNAADSGAIDSSNAPEFDVPGSTTVAYVGFWSAESAGTFYGAADVTDEVFAGQGTYSLTDCDLDLNG
jgi:hypothetical protein